VIIILRTFYIIFHLIFNKRGCRTWQLQILFLNQISFLWICDRSLAHMTLFTALGCIVTRISQGFVSGRIIMFRCISTRWIKQKLTITYIMKRIQIALHYRRVRKTAKGTISLVVSPCLSVRLSFRPSLHIEHVGSPWKDFHKIWYLSIFRKSFDKIKISLTSGKNNRYIARRSIYVFDHTSLNSS
jgi:hypothetical protein